MFKNFSRLLLISLSIMVYNSSTIAFGCRYVEVGNYIAKFRSDGLIHCCNYLTSLRDEYFTSDPSFFTEGILPNLDLMYGYKGNYYFISSKQLQVDDIAQIDFQVREQLSSLNIIIEAINPSPVSACMASKWVQKQISVDEESFRNIFGTKIGGWWLLVASNLEAQDPDPKIRETILNAIKSVVSEKNFAYRRGAIVGLVGISLIGLACLVYICCGAHHALSESFSSRQELLIVAENPPPLNREPSNASTTRSDTSTEGPENDYKLID